MSKIRDAEMFARGAHLGQKHGERPYHAHLYDVVLVLRRWGRDTETLVCGAWLHDTIEDTPATYHDIRNLFGGEIAELVWAVTDEIGRNRKERKEKTHPKIFASHGPTVLKLADLTANIEEAFKGGSMLCQMYAKEWPEMKIEFTQALTEHGEVHLLDALDRLGSIINKDCEAKR